MSLDKKSIRYRNEKNKSMYQNIEISISYQSNIEIFIDMPCRAWYFYSRYETIISLEKEYEMK